MSGVGTTYGPAVRRKRTYRVGGLASMYPAFDRSVLHSWPSWISARWRKSPAAMLVELTLTVVNGQHVDVATDGVRPRSWTVSCGGFDSLPCVVILELCGA